MNSIVVVAAFALSLAGSAQANTYTFDQTGGTPGFHAAVRVVLAGDAARADLPIVEDAFDSTGPYDFAPLIALKIAFVNPGGAGRARFTLADFTAPTGIGGFPRWAIAPGVIGLFDESDTDDFTVAGLGPVTVDYATDGGGLCGKDAGCVATGAWAAPGPSSGALAFAWLTGLVAFGRRNRHPVVRR